MVLVDILVFFLKLMGRDVISKQVTDFDFFFGGEGYIF